jgi:hypothetical protein
MSAVRIAEAIESLIEDPEFQFLNRAPPETTLFDILRISLEERTHSRMLGWLLNPSESHGLGDVLVRRFLYEASKLARSRKIDFGPAGHPITPLQAQTFSFRDLVVNPEYTFLSGRRIDLLLWSESGGWLCGIENKILSDEGDEQTTDYYREMLISFPVASFPHRLFVYLTPKRG